MKKFIKIMNHILSILFSVALVLTTFFISIIPLADSQQYYMNQFYKNDVSNNTGFSFEELEIISKAIRDFLFDRSQNMQVILERANGETVTVFSDQALSHMADCKVLFMGGMYLGYTAVILLILTGIYLLYRHSQVSKIVRRSIYIAYGIVFVVVLGLGISALIDFDWTFREFHHILFPDPAKFENAFFPYDDTLINILTEQFFFDIAFAFIFRIFSCIIVTISTIEYLKSKRFKKAISKYDLKKLSFKKI